MALGDGVVLSPTIAALTAAPQRRGYVRLESALISST